MHHDEIERYLREVGLRLRGKDLIGEILILGGAYMTLVLRSRGATETSMPTLRVMMRRSDKPRLMSRRNTGYPRTG